MDGIKLGFKLADYAKMNKMGIGSFRLKDGSSMKIMSNPDKQLFTVMNIKNGRMRSLEGGRGLNALANTIGKYEQKAENIDDVTTAIGDSFNIII